MAMILIDARYYSEQLRHARRMLHLSALDTAKLLKISVNELHKYELGKRPIPSDLIFVLMHRGLALSMCRAYKIRNQQS